MFSLVLLSLVENGPVILGNRILNIVKLNLLRFSIGKYRGPSLEKTNSLNQKVWLKLALCVWRRSENFVKVFSLLSYHLLVEMGDLHLNKRKISLPKFG